MNYRQWNNVTIGKLREALSHINNGEPVEHEKIHHELHSQGFTEDDDSNTLTKAGQQFFTYLDSLGN